jgi:alpha-glucosidase
VATRQLAALSLSPEQADDMQLLLLKLSSCLIGSSCIFQGEELGLNDVRDIPPNQMQDPWGIEFAPLFLGRDPCRTPMVWRQSQKNGGFSDADHTWLPVASSHLGRAGLDEAERSGSIYTKFSTFLKWRKEQPALMTANEMGSISGGKRQIIFDRLSDQQTLRCCFDFDRLEASFGEI